jgi:hypothetical protein
MGIQHLLGYFLHDHFADTVTVTRGEMTRPRPARA